MKLYEKFKNSFENNKEWVLKASEILFQCMGKKLLQVEYVCEGRINIVFRLVDKSLCSFLLRICMMDNLDFIQWVNVLSSIEPIFNYYSFTNYCKVYYEDNSMNIIPYPYTIIEEIQGLTLTKSHGEYTFYHVGCVLAKLHSTPLNFWGSVQKKQYEFSADIYYKDYYNKILTHLEKYNKDLYKITKNIIESYYCPDLDINRIPVLLHHDFHFSNILVNHDNSVILIDWDSARGGLPELDFIKIKYMNFVSTSIKKVKAFINGYNNRKDIKININYFVYEIVWLAKMIVFETCNKNNNTNYYPSKQFYIKMFDNAVKKITKCKIFDFTLCDYSISNWLCNYH